MSACSETISAAEEFRAAAEAFGDGGEAAVAQEGPAENVDEDGGKQQLEADLAQPGPWQDMFAGADAVLISQAQIGGLEGAAFTANNITDGHDCISFGIDGLGYMHLSWGMHADAYHYARSLTPVTGTNGIAFGPDGTMTGKENTVTYPQFMNLPNGDLLYSREQRPRRPSASSRKRRWRNSTR